MAANAGFAFATIASAWAFRLWLQTINHQPTLAEAMGKYRQKLWKLFSKDGRVTAPPGTPAGEQVFLNVNP
jgi:hypothetical protein